MKKRITVAIFLIAQCAANAHADGFAPWTRTLSRPATPAPISSTKATVPPTGFAPWATVRNPVPGAAAMAGGGPCSRFHGFGPWISARA